VHGSEGGRQLPGHVWDGLETIAFVGRRWGGSGRPISQTLCVAHVREASAPEPSVDGLGHRSDLLLLPLREGASLSKPWRGVRVGHGLGVEVNDANGARGCALGRPLSPLMTSIWAAAWQAPGSLLLAPHTRRSGGWVLADPEEVFAGEMGLPGHALHVGWEAYARGLSEVLSRTVLPPTRMWETEGCRVGLVCFFWWSVAGGCWFMWQVCFVAFLPDHVLGRELIASSLCLRATSAACVCLAALPLKNIYPTSFARHYLPLLPSPFHKGCPKCTVFSFLPMVIGALSAALQHLGSLVDHSFHPVPQSVRLACLSGRGVLH
jgi:hypothetical protein